MKYLQNGKIVLTFSLEFFLWINCSWRGQRDPVLTAGELKDPESIVRGKRNNNIQNRITNKTSSNIEMKIKNQNWNPAKKWIR
jgi:hypothetical protein